LTEDVSRISCDMGDAAHIFKRLQFAGISLIGLSDDIDTSAKQRKLSYAFKSRMAECMSTSCAVARCAGSKAGRSPNPQRFDPRRRQ
jgi:hypothetical protein